MKHSSLGHYQYQENHLLGQGSTGKVFAGIDTRTNKKVAVKAIQLTKMTNDILKYLLNNQKKALQQIINPYVLKLLDIFEDSNYCFIVTEYYQSGSLADYIDLKRRIPEKQAMEILKKIAIGLKAIHAKNFIHRDMKSQNIMLRNQDPAIIDFGYCENLFSLKPRRKYNVGSPAYMSPQAYLDSKYSFQSDIWALGVIFHQMLTSQVLDQITPMKQFFKNMIKRGSVKIEHQFSKQAMKILSATLHINPRKRVSIDELINIIDGCLNTFQTEQQIKYKIKRGNSQQIKPVPFSLRNIDKQNFIRMESKEKESFSFTQSPSKYLRIKKNIGDEKNGLNQQQTISPVKQYSSRYHKQETSAQIYSPQIKRHMQIHSQRNIHMDKNPIQMVSVDPQNKYESQYPNIRAQYSKFNRKFNQISNFFNSKTQSKDPNKDQIERKTSYEYKDREVSLNLLDNKYPHLKSYSQKKLNLSGFQNNQTNRYGSYTTRLNKHESQPSNYLTQSPTVRPQLKLLRNHIKYGDKFSNQEK